MWFRRAGLVLCSTSYGPSPSLCGCLKRAPRKIASVTARDDIASVAGQLAALTKTVEEMALQLKELRERSDSQQERADSQQERTDTQQERIDLAARELADVSERLQAAANALRESI
jgi:hypothetical protein